MNSKKGGSSSSCIVIADTHLGLMKEVKCEPDKLGSFTEWLIDLENSKKKTSSKSVKRGRSKEPKSCRVKVYGKDGQIESKTLSPPEELIMAGDMLDIWDSTDREAEFASRPFLNSLERLSCKKTYLFGNHDYDMHSLAGKYPSGNKRGASKGADQSLQILKGEPYPEQKPKEKLANRKVMCFKKLGKKNCLFVHGHQFESKYSQGIWSWRAVSAIRSGGLAFGDLGNFFVGLFAFSLLGLLGSVGGPLAVLLLVLFFLLDEKKVSLIPIFATILPIVAVAFQNTLPFIYLGMIPIFEVLIILLLITAYFPRANWLVLSILIIVPWILAFACAFTTFYYVMNAMYVALLPLIHDILGSVVVFSILSFLAIPPVVYRAGINVIRSFSSARYNYKKQDKWIDKYWKELSDHRRIKIQDQNEEPIQNLVVVYGHTHVLNYVRRDETMSDPREVAVEFFNVPAWIKDESRRRFTKEVRHNQELRDACLYIDGDEKNGEIFLGWDWDKQRPFHIPQEIVKERNESAKIKTEGGYLRTWTSSYLPNIGWPPMMIVEWIGWRRCIAKGDEIQKQILYDTGAKVKVRKGIGGDQEKKERQRIVMTSCCYKLAHEDHIEGKYCPNCGKDLSRFKPNHKWEGIIKEWFRIYETYDPYDP